MRKCAGEHLPYLLETSSVEVLARNNSVHDETASSRKSIGKRLIHCLEQIATLVVFGALTVADPDGLAELLG